MTLIVQFFSWWAFVGMFMCFVVDNMGMTKKQKKVYMVLGGPMLWFVFTMMWIGKRFFGIQYNQWRGGKRRADD